MGDFTVRRWLTATGLAAAMGVLLFTSLTLWMPFGPGTGSASAAPTGDEPRTTPTPSPTPSSTPTPSPDPTPSDTPTTRPPATPRDASSTCRGREPIVDFRDTTGNVHASMIDCISSYAVTQGTGDGVYGTAAPLTRGQVATFLVRTLEASGRSLPEAEPVCAGPAHGESLDAVAAAGIMPHEGCATNQWVNRSHMAQATAGALRWAAVTPDDAPDYFFDDENRVQAIQDAHDVVAHTGIVVGTTHGFFSPDQLLRRDQMATFLARLLDALLDG